MMLHGSYPVNNIGSVEDYREFWRESPTELKIKLIGLEALLIGAGVGIGAAASAVFNANTKTLMTAGGAVGGAIGLWVFHELATFKL